MGRKKKKTPTTSPDLLGPLMGPLKMIAVCILVFSLVCTPQFWSTARSTKNALKDVFNTMSATIQAKMAAKPSPIDATASVINPSKPTAPTTSSTPPNKEPTTTTIATPTTTTPTTTPINTTTFPTIPLFNSKLLNDTRPDDNDNAADMATALLKLTHMLYSIDHNISFTTNKTMTTEENLKRIGGGPFRDDILNELGIVHFQQGNRTEALSMWRQALLFNSASFRVHLNFAQTLFKGQDNITKLQLESDRQEALNTLKSLLGLRQQCEPHKQVGKKRKKAPLPAHCTHLLEHKKEFHNVLFDGYQLMGTIQSFYEKPFVAETYYKQALKMKPWDQQLHVLLAGVYENMGLFGQAKNYYKQCMKLGTSKGAGVLKATREAAEEDAAAAAEAAAAKGKSGGKQGKKNKKNNLFKKTQAQVVEDAYAQMKRERMGSVCGERMNKLEERMKKWVELKGDTYVNLKDGKR